MIKLYCVYSSKYKIPFEKDIPHIIGAGLITLL